MVFHSIVDHMARYWMIHTFPVAFFSLVTLISCSPFMDLLPLLVWLHFPAYVLHQGEEYIYPGGFKHIFNTSIGKALTGGFENIMTDEEIAFINVFIVWGLHITISILTQHVDVRWGIILPFFVLSNALLHCGSTISHRRYNPGFFTSIILFIPLGSFTLFHFFKAGLTSWLYCSAALLFAIIVHTGIFLYFIFKGKELKCKL